MKIELLAKVSVYYFEQHAFEENASESNRKSVTYANDFC
jgi:hypothetical protein